jgi:predicted nucleotidyltransferase
MINLSDQALSLIKFILSTYVPNYPIWLFGSRTTPNIKPYSDVDLAIISNTPLPTKTLAELEMAFAQSDLPYKVDLVEWSALDETFKSIIQANHEILA